jgi:hypothetical protein
MGLVERTVATRSTPCHSSRVTTRSPVPRHILHPFKALSTSADFRRQVLQQRGSSPVFAAGYRLHSTNDTFTTTSELVPLLSRFRTPQSLQTTGDTEGLFQRGRIPFSDAKTQIGFRQRI